MPFVVLLIVAAVVIAIPAHAEPRMRLELADYIHLRNEDCAPGAKKKDIQRLCPHPEYQPKQILSGLVAFFGRAITDDSNFSVLFPPEVRNIKKWRFGLNLIVDKGVSAYLAPGDDEPAPEGTVIARQDLFLTSPVVRRGVVALSLVDRDPWAKGIAGHGGRLSFFVSAIPDFVLFRAHIQTRLELGYDLGRLKDFELFRFVVNLPE